ncbi:hypothetical protein IMZ48_07975 [Candidatus Bathyarchaeota archaeon]|nr:hypothetical protein [Candidatus Bathyarchaeota archaeon]
MDGFDPDRMRDRALLTAAEEKALMRRVDWRMMTVCSLLFLLKNIDADNISNARIMNKGTGDNIMTELGMSSDQYNLLNVFYYVSCVSILGWCRTDEGKRSRTSSLRRRRICCLRGSRLVRGSRGS